MERPKNETVPERFRGRVALVTGAASGIGRATAIRLAREGARVHLTDIDAEGLAELTGAIADEGLAATHSVADVTDPRDRRAAVEECLSEYGVLHVLINNAGSFLQAPFLESSAEAYRRVADVNLKGAFFMAQEAARAIKASGGGAINNTSSVNGQEGKDRQGITGEAVTRAALGTLTRLLAVELAPLSIRVNGVCPGFISTGIHADQWRVPRSRRAYVLERIPLRRQGTPEEVAAVHAFLASGEASYVTGALIAVDGGFTLT